MLKKLLPVLIAFCCGTVLAATSTERLRLTKPARGDSNWDTTLNNNFNIIDSSMAVQTASNTFTDTNVFSSGTVFNGSVSFLGGVSGLPASTNSVSGVANAVQFNDAGTFGGSGDFIWNGSSILVSGIGAGGIRTLSTDTRNALQVTANGVPSGGLQNQTGGALNIRVNSVSEAMVITSSQPNSQAGASFIWMDQQSPGWNDPILYINDRSSNSAGQIKMQAYAPNFELVNRSTATTLGRGKWEPFASAYQSHRLQMPNSRAWDDSTFENMAYWEPLSAVGAGMYLQSQSLANDSAVLSSSDTQAINFFTQNNRTVGITGPLNTTASWTIALPSTTGDTGQLMYHNGVRGNNNNARQMEFTVGGTTGQCLQFTTGGRPTWGSCGGTSSSTVNNVDSLQTGATFYVSSGTVAGPLAVTGGTFNVTGTSNTTSPLMTLTHTSGTVLTASAQGNYAAGSFSNNYTGTASYALSASKIAPGTGVALFANTDVSTAAHFSATTGTALRLTSASGDALKIETGNAVLGSNVSVTGSGAGQLYLTEGAASTLSGASTGVDVLWADSSSNTFVFNPNNTSTYTVVGSSTGNNIGNLARFSKQGAIVDLGMAVPYLTVASSISVSSNTVLPGATFYAGAPLRLGGHAGTQVSSLYINAGNSAVTGAQNTMIGSPGFPTATALTSGNSITTLGFRAGNAATTDTALTAIGDQAAIAANGSASVTAIGGSALFSNTTGGSNTCVGKNCLVRLVSGSGNTALGTSACDNNTLPSSTTHSNAICIGANSQVDQSNTMAIGSIANPIFDVWMNSKQTGNTVGSSTTFHAQPSSGTNRAGGMLGLAGGNSSGNAEGGPVVISVSSSSTSGTLTNQLVVISTFTFPGPIMKSQTAAQLAAQNPAAAHQWVACSDCTALMICSSTGTTRGAWVSAVDKAVVCQ